MRAPLPPAGRVHAVRYLDRLIAVIVFLSVSALVLLFWKDRSFRAAETLASEYHLATTDYCAQIEADIAALGFGSLPPAPRAPGPSELQLPEGLDLNDFEQRFAIMMGMTASRVDAIANLQRRFDDSAYRQGVERVISQFARLRARYDSLDAADRRTYDAALESLAGFWVTVRQLNRLHTSAHNVVRARMDAEHRRQVKIIAIFFVVVLLIGAPVSIHLYKLTHSAVSAMQSVSLTDDLTGLNNRRGLMTLADQQIKTARRNRLDVSLVFFDLDGLKDINDTWGHDVGNEALLDTARVLQATARESDLVARVGGDEFVVLLAGSGEAERFVGRLREQLQSHGARSRRPYALSVSAGIAHLDPAESASLEDLIIQADHAMYAHKRRQKSPDVGIRMVSVTGEHKTP